jgi:hypothetical protein
MRAILVASGSLTAAPQFEQKRTLGVTYAPQLEQVIALKSSLVLIMLPKRSRNTKKFHAKAHRKTQGGKGLKLFQRLCVFLRAFA